MKNTLMCCLMLVFISGQFISCTSDAKPKNFDYGKVVNGTYVNSYFNMEMMIPDGWVVQSQEAMEAMNELGKDLVAGENEDLKTLLDASEVNTANLIAVFKYEVGAAVEYNPNVILVAENLKNAPGVKTGADYLFHTRNLIKQSQLKLVHIDEEFENQKIGGMEFYEMDMTMAYLHLKIHQKYYCTINNGFCVSAIISYTQEEQLNELQKIIESIASKG